MKNNTNTIKNSLEKALQNFPEDFSLIIVKQYIQMALYKLNEVELKRNKRELKNQKRKEESI